MGNKWEVYEFCKQNREALSRMSKSEQYKYLRRKLTRVNSMALAEGLEEFRSVPEHTWEWEVNSPTRIDGDEQKVWYKRRKSPG
jgi:hypothetical protein